MRADGNTHYAGEACGVIFTLEDGRTIYHAGDTCSFRDMKLIRKIYNPVIALVPIGDRFTMGPKEAAYAVDKYIKPEVAIPIHFGTFDLLTGTAEEFSVALQESESKAVVLEPGGVYTF